jgi:hypothetical protein
MQDTGFRIQDSVGQIPEIGSESQFQGSYPESCILYPASWLGNSTHFDVIFLFRN